MSSARADELLKRACRHIHAIAGRIMIDIAFQNESVEVDFKRDRGHFARLQAPTASGSEADQTMLEWALAVL